MSPEDRNRYMYSLNKYRTNLSVMKNEREEGRAEGRANRDKEIVMRMFSKGMEVAEIADMLGLTTDKVTLIISEL